MLMHSKNARGKKGDQRMEDFIRQEPIDDDVACKVKKKEKRSSKRGEICSGSIAGSEGKDIDDIIKVELCDDDDVKYKRKKKRKKHKRIIADHWVKPEIPENYVDGCETCSCEAVNKKLDHSKSHPSNYNNEADKKEMDSRRKDRTNTEVTADISDSKGSFDCKIYKERKKKKKKTKYSRSQKDSSSLVDIPLEEMTSNHGEGNLPDTEISHAHLEKKENIKKKVAQEKKEKSRSHAVEVMTESDGNHMRTDVKNDYHKTRKRKHVQSDLSIALEENDAELVVTKKKRSNFNDNKMSESQESNYDKHVSKKKKNKKGKKKHIPSTTESKSEKFSKSRRTHENCTLVLSKTENNSHSVFSSCDKDTKKYGGKPQKHKEIEEAFTGTDHAIDNSVLSNEKLAIEHEVDTHKMQKVNVSKYHLKWHISAKDKEECRRLGIEFEKGRWRPEEIEKLQENFQGILLQTGMTKGDLVKLIEDTSAEARRRRIDLGIYHILLEGINRPIQLVYQKLKKLCDPTHFKGKWLKSEEEKLLELYNIHGNNWVKIGELIGRSGDSVLHKVQRLLCGPVTKSAPRVTNTSRWTEDEIERLSKAVGEIRNSWEDNCTDVRKCDSKYIPWSKVAKSVKTRSAESCRYKWVFDLSLREPGNKKMHWTTEQNLLFLEKLSTCAKKHENDVDWIQILNDLELPGTEEVARKKWKAYRLSIPHHKELDFEKQLDWLILNFVKRIREKSNFVKTA